MKQHLHLALALSLISLSGCLPPAQPKQAPAPAPATPDEPVVAKAGVGKEGQSLTNESGVGSAIAAPAVAYFKTKQKVVFDIQIPQALNLFQAEKGYKPRSHQEFMDMIVKANQINLPELPEGKVYNYHPDDGQLWVEPVK